MTEKPPVTPILELLDEIKAFDWSIFPPTADVNQEEDQVLGDCPEDLRRFYSFSRYCERELKQLMVEMEFVTDKDPDNERRMWQLSKRHNVTTVMFWFCVWEYFKAYGSEKSIGLRRGWKVVLSDHKQPDMPPMVRRILGIE